jgi:hypothetical protein
MPEEIEGLFEKRRKSCEIILAELKRSSGEPLALALLFQAVKPGITRIRGRYDTDVFESDLAWLEEFGKISVSDFRAELFAPARV